MFNNTNMMFSNVMVPFDQAFRAQAEQMYRSQRYTRELLETMYAEWERNKSSIVQEITNKYPNYTNETITQAIYQFAQRFVSYYLQRQQQYDPNCPSFLGGGTTGFYGNNGMNSPFNGSGISYQPSNCNINNPMIPTGSVGNGNVSYDMPATQQPQQSITSARDEKGVSQPLTVTKLASYTKPIDGEPDPVYDTKLWDTSLGKIHVTSLIDGYGVPFKYVDINLSDPCNDTETAISRAKMIYKKSPCATHMDVTYTKTASIGIPYDDCVAVMKQLKQAISRSSKANNKLQYLKGFEKILNLQNRGIADAIEDFLIGVFLREGKTGCSTSDNNDILIVETLNHLIQLSDKNTPDINSQAWQKIPGFVERLIVIVNNTIKHVVDNAVILNPSDPKDFNTILRSYAGLTENEDGELVDIILELNDKRDAYCAATLEDKRTLFGAAGRIVADNTIICVPDEKLVITDFMVDGSLGTKDHSPVLFVANHFIGGKDANGTPNNVDNDFEYMMLNYSLTEGKYATVIVNHAGGSIKYECTKTLDDWYHLVPNV